MTLRPSGQLSWLLERLTPSKWDVIGCLSSETRWNSAWQCVERRAERQHYLQIEDAVGVFGGPTAETHAANLDRQLALAVEVPGFRPDRVLRAQLLARSPDVIRTVESVVNKLGPNVILDTSCMPKRYLFPLMRKILDAAPDNLVVAYTSAQSHGDVLGYSSDDWAPLPLFLAEIDTDPLIIASVGYEPSGLAQILGEMPKTEGDLRFVLPVGTSASSSRRSWEFLHHVWPDLPLKWQAPPLRVEVHDLSGTFDTMRKVIDRTNRNVVFAPFGPKPTSVAMCLLASMLPRATVLYAQPSYYAQDYSTGVHDLSPGVPACVGHCVRLNGVDAYSLCQERGA